MNIRQLDVSSHFENKKGPTGPTTPLAESKSTEPGGWEALAQSSKRAKVTQRIKGHQTPLQVPLEMPFDSLWGLAHVANSWHDVGIAFSGAQGCCAVRVSLGEYRWRGGGFEGSQKEAADSGGRFAHLETSSRSSHRSGAVISSHRVGVLLWHMRKEGRLRLDPLLSPGSDAGAKRELSAPLFVHQLTERSCNQT